MRPLWCSATIALMVGLCGGCTDERPDRQGTSSVAAGDQAGSTGLEASPTTSVASKAATTSPAPGGLDPAAVARVESIQRLIDEGIDVNKADPDGRTALMMAAFDGYTEVVELLLDHGAEVDHPDGLGRTALMYASSGPFPETVELLIGRGADVNRVDSEEGWSALMLAAAEGHRPVVEVLLRSGADLEAADKDGDKAIDHARNRGQGEVVTLLSSRS